METITDFFEKLGAIYGRLNLISKPIQVYNCDETGVSVVNKPGKVVAELGRRNVYAITSGEKGKTHTLLSCASASSFVLPPMMIYPRKQLPHANFREGTIADTLFINSSNGWINSDNGLSSSCNISHQLGQCCSSWMGMGLTCQLTSLN